jgi:hypothetical protein
MLSARKYLNEVDNILEYQIINLTNFIGISSNRFSGVLLYIGGLIAEKKECVYFSHLQATASNVIYMDRLLLLQ